ncbi:FAD-dependent oxidoreductase [Desulfovibrio desulfuricans]|nr:FAD-dependent oxidoreductase [Desulfovibrio desulfuricans]MCB6543216.1 FAD-dependent oxidoreductase [Desulfovibrio desulfuricans]MCB6554335.1 FAD-dependent oxidoreductase [Desulfovibrio desulfuricans]MCB6566166.1 FAD-dependent oxidoreductase [Desulfovibrio desulfuricans]MCB7347206.1 FAD-dependent oxidoreductase [Desulfovibrio desulfuricans]MCQ4861487.1 FAD-dependent oxidoreductase [Desulfovibrio desulfuricans]
MNSIPFQKNCKVVIIGAGLAGLSCASKLIDSNVNCIVVEKNSPGGFLNIGGVKISLLPAGAATANIIGFNNYVSYQKKFFETIKPYLTHVSNKKIDYLGIHKVKTYDSFLLNNHQNYTSTLLHKIKAIYHEEIVNIKKVNNFYILNLKNGGIIKCEAVVIATGRDASLVEYLKQLGQIYLYENNAIVGCRAVFNAKESNKIYKQQLDYKIKSDCGFQTYCFNYKGDLHWYKYNDKDVVSGIINRNAANGNIMIGKKIIINNNFLQLLNSPQIITQGQLDSFIRQTCPQIIGLSNFAQDVEAILGTNFTSYHFPALEQFWNKPIIKSSFESTTLKNIYFCGDASGVSFGFTQSFVTGHFVADQLLRSTCNS